MGYLLIDDLLNILIFLYTSSLPHFRIFFILSNITIYLDVFLKRQESGDFSSIGRTRSKYWICWMICPLFSESRAI